MESSRICAFLLSCILAVLLTGPQIFPVSSASTATLQSTTTLAAVSSLSTTSLAATSNQSTTSAAAVSTASVVPGRNQSTTSVAAVSTASVVPGGNQSTTSVAAVSTTSAVPGGNQSATSVAASSSTSTNNSATVTASVTTVTIASVTSMVTTTAVKSSTISGHSSSAEQFSTESPGTLGKSTTIISGSTSSYATSAATSTTPSQLTSPIIESTAATTPTTVAVSSSTSSHLPAPNISISETNLLLANDSFFVELQVNTGSLEGITLEILDASSNDVVQKVSFNASDTPFSVANLTNATLSQLKSVALILYSGPNATNRLVLDKLIFMRSDGQVDPSINETFTNPTTDGQVAPSINETFTNQTPKGYITIVNKEILVGLSNNISLSRCWSGNNNSDTFIVTQMTKNEINNCTRSGHDIQLYLTSSSSTPCEEISKNLAVLYDVKLWVAKQINAQCQCGMTPHLLEDTRPKCRNKPSDLLLTLNITGAFPKQVELFVKAYQESIQKNTDTIATESVSFTVVNCTQQCFHDDPEQNDNGKYSVTVAVVLSCIAVFSIIFIAVIVYMKRKRRGLLQFRMTRLAEDDDDLIGDMEDFVGSSENHEPSFRNDSS